MITTNCKYNPHRCTRRNIFLTMKTMRVCLYIYRKIIIIILFIKPLISNFSLRSRVALRLKRYRARKSTRPHRCWNHSSFPQVRTSHASTPERQKIAESSAVNDLRVVSRRSFFVEGQKRVESSRARNKRELEGARWRKDRLSTMRCDERNRDRMRRIKPPTLFYRRVEERGIRKRERRQIDRKRKRTDITGERQTDKVVAR